MNYSNIIQALEKLNNNINRDIGTHIIPPDTLIPINFQESKFQELISTQNNETKVNETKVAFIDGGNAEIIGSSNFSLQLIRVYSCTYNKKRIDSFKKEFFTLIYLEDNYKISIFNKSNEKIDLPSEIELDDQSPQEIAEQIRKLAELETINQIQADLIIRDGDLVSQNDLEKIYLDKIKHLPIIGLSKTSRLYTNTGCPAQYAVKSLSKNNNPWLFQVAKGIPNIFYAKFHSKSKYIFRVDVIKDINLTPILSLSKDPIFLGYPYGLIEADKHARVTNQEVNYFKMLLEAKAGKSFEKIKDFTNTINAHDILDNI